MAQTTEFPDIDEFAAQLQKAAKKKSFSNWDRVKLLQDEWVVNGKQHPKYIFKYIYTFIKNERAPGTKQTYHYCVKHNEVLDHRKCAKCKKQHNTIIKMTREWDNGILYRTPKIRSWDAVIDKHKILHPPIETIYLAKGRNNMLCDHWNTVCLDITDLEHWSETEDSYIDEVEKTDEELRLRKFKQQCDRKIQRSDGSYYIDYTYHPDDLSNWGITIYDRVWH